MKKIPGTAKIGRGRRPSPIWLSAEFFELSYYFQIGQACSPLTCQLYSWLVYNLDFLACHRREILYTSTCPFFVETKTHRKI